MSQIVVVTAALLADERDLRFLQEAVDSVYRQTFQDWEMVITVDDGLTLAAPDDPRITILRHDKRRGPGAARNTAVSASNAEWILPLDHDDRLPPDALERLFAARCVNEVTYGDVEWIGEKTGYQALFEYTRERMAALDGLFPVTALHSRVGWTLVKGWDETLSGLEDVDYWLRLIEQGICPRRIPHVTLDYRKRSDSRQALLEDASRKADLVAIKDTIRLKHTRFFSGDAMPCLSCPGGQPVMSDIPSEVQPQGWVEMQYVGLMQGGFFTANSPVTNNRYRIDGKDAHFYADPRDVNWLLSIQRGGLNYVRVTQAAPALRQQQPTQVAPQLQNVAPDSTEDITAMNVTQAVALLRGVDEVDLRVYYAKEQSSLNPRKTVIAEAEKLLRAYDEGATT